MSQLRVMLIRKGKQQEMAKYRWDRGPPGNAHNPCLCKLPASNHRCKPIALMLPALLLPTLLLPTSLFPALSPTMTLLPALTALLLPALVPSLSAAQLLPALLLLTIYEWLIEIDESWPTPRAAAAPLLTDCWRYCSVFSAVTCCKSCL